MLQDEYLPAKLGFDTAEIEPSKHLQKFGNILQNNAYLPTRRAEKGKKGACSSTNKSYMEPRDDAEAPGRGSPRRSARGAGGAPGGRARKAAAGGRPPFRSRVFSGFSEGFPAVIF